MPILKGTILEHAALFTVLFILCQRVLRIYVLCLLFCHLYSLKSNQESSLVIDEVLIIALFH